MRKNLFKYVKIILRDIFLLNIMPSISLKNRLLGIKTKEKKELDENFQSSAMTLLYY